MQIPIDLSGEDYNSLIRLAKLDDKAVQALIQQVLQEYLVQRHKDIQEAAFGAWGEGEDGLAYQERLRSEW